MKTYDKYKSSGIDWIGDIPEHWESLSLRRITEEHRQGYYTTKEYLTEGVKLIRITDLDENGNISYDKMPYVEISEKDEEVFQVKYGDFLFPRTGSIGLLGLVNKDERAVFASYLINFRFKKHLSPDFLKFYFFSDAFKSGIISDLHGGVNQNIHAENIKNQFIAIPSFPEQTAIAEYLDEKTAQTDKLIDEKRRLIELLKEERLGVINQAVTRGINPHAKLKPSGIAWLGDIPEHWEVKKLKFLTNDDNKGAIKTGPFGSHIKNSDFMLSGEYKVYNQRNVLDNDFEKGTDFISEEKFEELSGFEIFENDILVTTRGTIGKCAIFPKEFLRGVLHPCLIRIQLNNKKVLNHWIKIFFNQSSYFLENVMLLSNSTTIEVIYSYNLKEVFIPLPPIEEQKQIVEFIETAAAKIDAGVDLIEKEIGFLREYRTALISEVVTGKIKVN